MHRKHSPNCISDYTFYRDLAYQLRRKLGDWFRVVQILQSGAIASDAMQNEAWNELGDFYYDRQQWLVFLYIYFYLIDFDFFQGNSSKIL